MLVSVVGQIGQEVGRFAGVAHQHPVLVVPELGGTEPGGAVLLKHVPAFLEPLVSGPDAVRIEFALAEPAVEGGAVGGEIPLLPGLDTVHGHAGHEGSLFLRREFPQGLGGGSVERFGQGPQVVAAVALFRNGRRPRSLRLVIAGQETLSKEIDLPADVVDVELAFRVVATHRKQPGQHATERRGAGVDYVERPGRVRADVLHQHPLPPPGIAPAVAGSGAENLLQPAAQPCPCDPEIDEPRSGDLDRLEQVVPGGQLINQGLGDGPRGAFEAPGEGHGEVGRVIAVGLLAGDREVQPGGGLAAGTRSFSAAVSWGTSGVAIAT